jgi:hypothetical protein
MIGKLTALLLYITFIVGLGWIVYTLTVTKEHTYTVGTDGSLLPHGYSCVGKVVVHNRGGVNLLGRDGKVVGCTGEVRLNWAEREEWESKHAE